MGKNDLFTKSLAAAGTLLAWAAILFMLATSIPGSISSGSFRMDYMIPAEIFFIPLIGTGLLIWGAFRARSHKKLILWGFAAEILLLFGSQGLAVVTGLASGDAEPLGWRLWLVLGGLIQDSVTNIEDTIPGVRSVPGVGQLLAQRKDLNQKTELVIFLRPTVIRDPSMDGDYVRLRDMLPGSDYFLKPNPSRESPAQ